MRVSTDCRYAKQEVIDEREKAPMPTRSMGSPVVPHEAPVRFQHGPAALAGALPEPILAVRGPSIEQARRRMRAQWTVGTEEKVAVPREVETGQGAR